jgi:hypothetical protein
MFPETYHHVQKGFSSWPVTTLKITIILWAIAVIILVLFVDNPWILAGILAYEVLP